MHLNCNSLLPIDRCLGNAANCPIKLQKVYLICFLLSRFHLFISFVLSISLIFYFSNFIHLFVHIFIHVFIIYLSDSGMIVILSIIILSVNFFSLIISFILLFLLSFCYYSFLFIYFITLNYISFIIPCILFIYSISFQIRRIVCFAHFIVFNSFVYSFICSYV